MPDTALPNTLPIVGAKDETRDAKGGVLGSILHPSILDVKMLDTPKDLKGATDLTFQELEILKKMAETSF